MEMRNRNTSRSVTLMALDWDGLGRTVREQVDQAIAMHVARLGDTDNPFARDAGQDVVPDSAALIVGMPGKRDRSSSAPESSVMGVSP